MVRQYQVTQNIRRENRFASALIRLGIGPSRWYLLAVKGRVSGELRETPIEPIEMEGRRFLVAPFGVVNWVKNARKAGLVRLRRGTKVEFLQVKEMTPTESAPVLRAYLRRGYTGDYFNAGPDSPLIEFENEASQHPVFLDAGPASPFD
jgi:F420H(2)-dependent quinone reductase